MDDTESPVPIEQWEGLAAGALAAELGLPPRDEARRKGRTEQIAIRLSVDDLERARAIAERKGLPYQTMLKGVIHEWLEREAAD